MDDVVSLGFDLSQILDKSEADAVAMLNAASRECRVAERDGKSLILKTDLRPNRVNLVVVAGVVSSYRLG